MARRPIGGDSVHRAPRVYRDTDFDTIARSVKVPAADVRKYADGFEEAATWIRLGERRPQRTPPAVVRRKMNQISETATRLLRHLGVDNPEQASDGPGDEEALGWLASAGDGGEDGVLAATDQIGLLIEVMRARVAALELRQRALKAANDPVYGLIVPEGNTGDDILNQWIGAMLPLYTAITGRRVATSTGMEGQPNEGIATGPLIAFLQAAGKPVGLDQGADALRRRVRLIQESAPERN